ncbi:MAG: hypothetical protein AAFQ58_08245 [Pseudomonadota bacterium]
MLREDIPIKTCDEIKYSIKGTPTPCNDNERVEGTMIYESYYHWQSVDKEPHGRMKSFEVSDGTTQMYYLSGTRAMFRIDDFLAELYRTGYRHRDIRDNWCEPMVSKLFPANAYIYDDRPVDVEALWDEHEFLCTLIRRLEQTRNMRTKALERYRKHEQKKREEVAAAED